MAAPHSAVGACGDMGLEMMGTTGRVLQALLGADPSLPSVWEVLQGVLMSDVRFRVHTMETTETTETTENVPTGRAGSRAVAERGACEREVEAGPPRGGGNGASELGNGKGFIRFGGPEG